MKTFDAAVAVGYDEDIRARIPGYDLMQDLICALLQAEVANEWASILVSGSGSGEEIARLGLSRPQWNFTAVDPAGPMHALAKQKFQILGLESRVHHEQKTIQQFQSVLKYEAGLSVLVSHFIPDEKGKIEYFKSLAQSLKSGAPLVIVDLVALPKDLCNKAISYLYFWAKQEAQLSPEQLQSLPQRLHSLFFPVSLEKFGEILKEARLELEGPFFQALGVQGLLARKI